MLQYTQMETKGIISPSFTGLRISVDPAIPNSAKFGVRMGDNIFVSKAMYDCLLDPDTFEATVESLQVYTLPVIEDTGILTCDPFESRAGKRPVGDWRIGY